MWIMISNSLDIDFIHSDIHGRSCKNIRYNMWDEITYPFLNFKSATTEV